MSRKTKSRHSSPSRRARSQRHQPITDFPRVERPLLLVCGACGASGKYNVGTITIDPTTARSSDGDGFEETIGFTWYFRCRECDAGGPWELPPKTLMYVMAMTIAATTGAEDVPLVLGRTATFDKRTFRYATDAEAHLKGLIDHEPERAFLWVRLGNLYSHSGQKELAKPAYERAIELDPKDIEAHSMLGQVHVDAGRPLEAVPNWHAVLKHARDARHVKKELRRELVGGAIECLLEAHAESNGKIDLLPMMDPGELERRDKDEPIVLEMRGFDLCSEEGISDLCDMFVERPRRSVRSLLRRKEKRLPDAPDNWPATPIHRAVPTIGRNDRCPCGSGHKYKKCCGR